MSYSSQKLFYRRIKTSDYVDENSIITEITLTVSFTAESLFLTITVNT